MRASALLPIAALALACACAEPAPTEEQTAAPAPPTATDVAGASTPAPTVTPAADCEALARLADADDADAYALAVLCPEHALGPALARAALMQVADPIAIRALLPRLGADAETASLARLALAEAPVSLPESLDDPVSAIVVPVDEHVLAQAALAHAMYISKTVAPEDRTRAQAYLAKVHLHALEALGMPPGEPLPPFARELAGRAIHHGRTFCTDYWQRRVAGLADLFADTESRLLDAVLDLEASPHRADSARVATERERGRAYLLAHESRMLATRSQRNPSATPRASASLQPLPARVDRLLDQGFVDLGITIALARGAEANGPGLAPAAAMVRDSLQRRALHEYASKLEQRLEQARAARPAPPESGPGAMDGPRPPGSVDAPSPEQSADLARAWLSAAPAAGFARRHALLRTTMVLEQDPAALHSLAADLDHELAPHAGLLMALALTADADTLTDARLLAEVDARWPEPGREGQEARLRRRLALANREAGNAPR